MTTAIVEVQIIALDEHQDSKVALNAATSVLVNYPQLDAAFHPTSATISGDLDTILRVVREIHNLPFQQGILNVATTIRILERRELARRFG